MDARQACGGRRRRGDDGRSHARAIRSTATRCAAAELVAAHRSVCASQAHALRARPSRPGPASRLQRARALAAGSLSVMLASVVTAAGVRYGEPFAAQRYLALGKTRQRRARCSPATTSGALVDGQSVGTYDGVGALHAARGAQTRGCMVDLGQMTAHPPHRGRTTGATGTWTTGFRSSSSSRTMATHFARSPVEPHTSGTEASDPRLGCSSWMPEHATCGFVHTTTSRSASWKFTDSLQSGAPPRRWPERTRRAGRTRRTGDGTRSVPRSPRP